MNVGDYVRTKYGKIGKIIDFGKALVFKPINYNEELEDIKSEEINIVVDTNYYFDDEKDSYSEYDIVKSSPNIIDLIEVGDIVNRKQVTRTFIDPFTKKRRLEIEGTEVNWQGDMSSIYIENEDIKSIVTHQQFKEMEYKVNGNCR